MRKVILLGMLGIASGVFAAAPVFPLGTYVVSGAVKNYKNALYEGLAEARVQVVATNGTILAESPILTPSESGEGWNFLLEIPVTKPATKLSAAIGDQVRLFVKDGPVLSVACDAITVEAANATKFLTAGVVDVTKFPSSHSSAVEGQVSVANAYLDEIAAWMDAYGYEKYLADADWDGDGISNYDEYLAGTNPFDAEDKLVVTSFTANNLKLHSLSFQYADGHVYAVEATADLANPEWTKSEIKTSPDQTGTQSQVLLPEGGIEGTIYIVPTTSAPQMFYRVIPE